MIADSDAIDQVVLAIHEFLRRSTIPILAKEQGQTVQRGTGSLFAVNGQHYLITAAHVVTGIDLELVGVALTQPDVWVLGPSRS